MFLDSTVMISTSYGLPTLIATDCKCFFIRFIWIFSANVFTLSGPSKASPSTAFRYGATAESLSDITQGPRRRAYSNNYNFGSNSTNP